MYFAKEPYNIPDRLLKKSNILYFNNKIIVLYIFPRNLFTILYVSSIVG